VFLYLGSQLETISANDPLLWIGALVVIGLLLLTARLRRLMAPEHSDEPARTGPPRGMAPGGRKVTKST